MCGDRRDRNGRFKTNARGVKAVSIEIDQLLRSKSLEDLNLLEIQIRKKLNSNEPIDVEYWEHLLSSLVVWKARAKLQDISRKVIDNRLTSLRNQEESEANIVQTKLEKILEFSVNSADGANNERHDRNLKDESLDCAKYDPELFLKIRVQEKGLDVIDEATYLSNIVSLMISSSFLSKLRILIVEKEKGKRKGLEAWICTFKIQKSGKAAHLPFSP